MLVKFSCLERVPRFKSQPDTFFSLWVLVWICSIPVLHVVMWPVSIFQLSIISIDSNTNVTALLNCTQDYCHSDCVSTHRARRPWRRPWWCLGVDRRSPRQWGSHPSPWSRRGRREGASLSEFLRERECVCACVWNTVMNTGLVSRSSKHAVQRRVPQGLAVGICTQSSDPALQHTGGQIWLIQKEYTSFYSLRHDNKYNHIKMYQENAGGNGAQTEHNEGRQRHENADNTNRSTISWYCLEASGTLFHYNT